MHGLGFWRHDPRNFILSKELSSVSEHSQRIDASTRGKLELSAIRSCEGAEANCAAENVRGAQRPEIATVEAVTCSRENEYFARRQHAAAVPNREAPACRIVQRCNRSRSATHDDATTQPANAIAFDRNDRLQQVGVFRQIAAPMCQHRKRTGKTSEDDVAPIWGRSVADVQAERNAR